MYYDHLCLPGKKAHCEKERKEREKEKEKKRERKKSVGSKSASE